MPKPVKIRSVLLLICTGLGAYALFNLYQIWRSNQAFDQMIECQSKAIEAVRRLNADTHERILKTNRETPSAATNTAVHESEKIMQVLESLHAVYVLPENASGKTIQQLSEGHNALEKHFHSYPGYFWEQERIFPNRSTFEQTSGKAYLVYFNSCYLNFLHLAHTALRDLPGYTIEDFGLEQLDAYDLHLSGQPIQPSPGDTVRFETFIIKNGTYPHPISIRLNNQSFTDFQDGAVRTNLTYDQPGQYALKLSGTVLGAFNDTLPVPEKTFLLKVR